MMTDIYLSTAPSSRGGTSAQAQQWMTLALEHFQAGRLDQASQLCARITEDSPDFAEAYNLWAAIAIQAARFDMAADLLGKAAELDGSVREYHHNRGTVLKDLGRRDEAILCFRESLRLAPGALDSLFELATCLGDLGRHDEAAPLFRALITAVPDVADGYYRHGNTKLFTGQNQGAIREFRRTVGLQPDFTDAHTNLAVMFRELGGMEKALEACRRALVLRPDDAFIYSNLCSLLREIDNRDDATLALERALKLVPEEPEFHYGLAMGRTFTVGDDRLAAMEQLAEKEALLDRPAQINLHFALAKAYEDIGDKDRSFDHQMQANALKRTMISYDEDQAIDRFERIERVYTAEYAAGFSQESGDSSDLPIFVLGMPRSGSSLVEQILASHPQVFGAGELPDFPTLARELGPDSGPFFPEIAPSMASDEFRALGARYVEGLRARAPQAARIVDKLPDNFRLIGLIRQALPNARIIHTRRDPIDTCLSIYSKLFTAEAPSFYDLSELGRHWRAYDELMTHWREVLPAGSFYDLDYEALVADQEGETRRLIEYCGLEWNDACLQFHNTKRTVRTASMLQVRKPLYKSSVGRWRPKAEDLAPLMAGLGRT